MKADVKNVTGSAVKFLEKLLAIDSPTNCCDEAIEFLRRDSQKRVL